MRSMTGLWIILASSAALLAGCGEGGPDMGSVSGTVTLDGKPLENAVVEFRPLEKNAAPSYGRTDKNGRYSLRFSATRDGAHLGNHRIQISMAQEEDERGRRLPVSVKLPANASNGSLQFQVEKGRNRADFDLTSA